MTRSTALHWLRVFFASFWLMLCSFAWLFSYRGCMRYLACGRPHPPWRPVRRRHNPRNRKGVPFYEP
ncbi:MAG: hypothetical protein AB1758_33580 [Candidatus Eremiobacterota bacterium]